MDTTYIQMHRGFAYPIVVLKRANRRLLSRLPSNSLSANPCLDAREESITK